MLYASSAGRTADKLPTDTYLNVSGTVGALAKVSVAPSRKPVPVMLTVAIAPTGPELDATPVIVGAVSTYVKASEPFVPLMVWVGVVTLTATDPAAVARGAIASISVSLANLISAVGTATPPKLTPVAPVKSCPVICTT